MDSPCRRTRERVVHIGLLCRSLNAALGLGFVVASRSQASESLNRSNWDKNCAHGCHRRQINFARLGKPLGFENALKFCISTAV